MAILGALTALVLGFDFDTRIAHSHYNGHGGWWLESDGFIQLLYHYGTWPAIVAVVGCAVVHLAGVIRSRQWAWRGVGIYMLLVLLVGPGLVVNTGFKDHFGRPRPRNVVEFGGAEKFTPVWHPRLGHEGTSFPSGHASMGFLWFGFAVYESERNRRRAWLFAGLALAHGTAMGFARVAQGAHWFSDVVWSAGFVYLAAWVIYTWMNFRPTRPN